LCITCGACYDACRFDAIEKARNAPVAAGGLISGGPPA
jgi:ferredoxin